MTGQHYLEAIDSPVQKTHEWHAVLVAGHVLAKLAVAAIPGVVIVALSVATVAAFVGGYLAALG